MITVKGLSSTLAGNRYISPAKADFARIWKGVFPCPPKATASFSQASFLA